MEVWKCSQVCVGANNEACFIRVCVFELRFPSTFLGMRLHLLGQLSAFVPSFWDLYWSFCCVTYNGDCQILFRLCDGRGLPERLRCLPSYPLTFGMWYVTFVVSVNTTYETFVVSVNTLRTKFDLTRCGVPESSSRCIIDVMSNPILPL